MPKLKWLLVLLLIATSFFWDNPDCVNSKKTPQINFQNYGANTSLFTDLEVLCQFNGRKSGTRDAAVTANYIAARFHDTGLHPFHEGYVYRFNLPKVRLETRAKRPHFRTQDQNNGGTGFNIAGYQPGIDPLRKQEYILVTAHYDHLGTENGKIYPGANDNASGVAILLETARYVKKQQFQRTVAFISFGAEEMGLLGSKHFVQKPLVPLSKIVAVINLDTLSSQNGSLAFWGKDQGLLNIALQLAKENHLQIAKKDFPQHGSDHLPFEKTGIPAFTLTATDWLHNNHTPEDTFCNLNKQSISRACIFTKNLISHLAKTTPGD